MPKDKKDKKHKKIVIKKKVKKETKTRRNKKQLNNFVPSFAPSFEVPLYSYQNRGAMNPPIMPSMEQLFMNAINSGLNYQQQTQPSLTPATTISTQPIVDNPIKPSTSSNKPITAIPKTTTPISTTCKSKPCLKTPKFIPASIDISKIEKPPFKEIITKTQQIIPQSQDIHNVSKEDIKKVETKIRKRNETIQKKPNINPSDFGQTNAWDVVKPYVAAVATPIIVSMAGGASLGQAIEGTIYGAISGGIGNRVANALGGDENAQLIGTTIGAVVGSRATKHIRKGISDGMLYGRNRITGLQNHWRDMNKYDSISKQKEKVYYDIEQGKLPADLTKLLKKENNIPAETNMLSASRNSAQDIINRPIPRAAPPQMGQSAATLRHRVDTSEIQEVGPSVVLDTKGNKYVPVKAKHPDDNRKVGVAYTIMPVTSDIEELDKQIQKTKNLEQMLRDDKKNVVKKTPQQIADIKFNLKEAAKIIEQKKNELGILPAKRGRPMGAKSKKND